MELGKEILDVNWSEPFEITAPESQESVPAKCIQCLQKCFGHSRFREMQWKIISSILDGNRDNCVIMATGYGKSLCYQFPSVYLNTITIVISPLISLMQDQVLAMCFYKLRACFLGSAQINRETLYDVIDQQYNIVYATPEYITSESGTFLLERIREHLTLIAIDEAHCISKWGHEFRHAYRNLYKLRDLCPAVPILAMTATATEQVRDDIIQSLNLRNAQIITTSFDRPNLKFIVKRKTKVWADIGPYIKNVKIGSVIVYCISRRITEEIASVITTNGQKCGIYHAGLSLKIRNQTHDDFIHDRIRVVVATIAFGMGINKPDVRLVIHYGVAKDVESYYQEVGRAGRDGMPAKCVMFYQEKDWALHRMIRDRCNLTNSKYHMEKLALVMANYLGSTECRRGFILSYFGEDCSKLSMRPDCCDNCKHCKSFATASINLFSKYQGLGEDGLLDITEEALKLLTLVHDIKVKFGLHKAFLILRGSKSKLVPQLFQFHPLYGSLKSKSEKWLQAVSNSLLQMEMLTMIEVNQANIRNSFNLRRCTISSKGKLWLSSTIKQTPIKVVPGEEFIRLLKPKVLNVPKILKPENLPSTSSAAASSSTKVTLNSNLPDIYSPLLKVRSKLASLFDAMPYLVASTKALQQLAKMQPTTMEELRKVRLDGYSEEKTERFGPVFLKVIKDYHIKTGKAVKVEQQKKQEQPTATVELKPVNMKLEPIFQVTHSLPSTNNMSFANGDLMIASNAEHETALISEINKQQSSFHEEVMPQSDAQSSVPLNYKNGEIDDKLASTQGSVEIIEPPPPPIILINSDDDSTGFANWKSDDDDDDNELLQVSVKVEEQFNCNHHSSDSENSMLDKLVDDIKGEALSQKLSDMKNSWIVEETTSPVFGCQNESDDDLFNGDWDLDIDDSDLTQVSEQAEVQFKCESIRSSVGQAIPLPDRPLEQCTNGEKTDLDLLLDAVAIDSNQNCTMPTQNKPRIIERKISKVFEYEDYSSSGSENDLEAIVSPKKRTLPSWMMVSNKKQR